MTDAERAWVKNMERDIVRLQKDVRELQDKMNQHTTVLYNLSLQNEAMRAGVFGNDGLTAH